MWLPTAALRSSILTTSSSLVRKVACFRNFQKYKGSCMFGCGPFSGRMHACLCFSRLWGGVELRPPGFHKYDLETVEIIEMGVGVGREHLNHSNGSFCFLHEIVRSSQQHLWPGASALKLWMGRGGVGCVCGRRLADKGSLCPPCRGLADGSPASAPM